MTEQSRILVADDEVIIAASLQLKLEQLGYDVTGIAHSGAEAIALSAEMKPDLVLMDIHFGSGMDGIEAARCIRAACGAAVVYLSAYSDDETNQRAKITEPFAYILKPVIDRELRIIVEIALYKRRAERALQLSEEKFRTVLETAGDAVISVDAHENIVYSNKAAERMFGFSPNEAVDMPLAAIIPARYHTAFQKGIKSSFSAGKPFDPGHTLSLCGIRKDGSEFPAEISVANWRTQDGSFVTAIFRDLTERLRAEEVMRKNIELAEANRAKDAFLGVVSHELRTPLTSIAGWTHLLRTGPLDFEKQAHAIDIIDRNTIALKRLVEEMLDIASINAGKMTLDMQSLNLVELASKALNAVRPSAAALGIELVRDFGTDVCTVSGDPNRLQQILNNLLSNAFKFSHAGERVTLSVRRVGVNVVIMVSDTGAGIDPQSVARVFDRFWQTDLSATRTYSGLGLGLSIVRELVELHGGTVRAESEGFGKGATFTVCLPASNENAVKSRKSESMARDWTRLLGDMRVLVVEGAQDIADFLVLSLEQNGAMVKACDSAKDAIALLERFKPDVLLCDIGLPDQDGFDLIRKIRALPPESGGSVPAIALTSFSRSEDRLAFLSNGFQELLEKTASPFELLVAVAKISGR